MENTELSKTIQDVVKMTINEYEKNRREEEKKRVLHNTKLLLKHYNSLKAHAMKSVYKIEDIEKDIEEIDGDDKAYILSIRRSKLRTLIMVSHIDAALKELKDKKLREGTYEQYRALTMFYIDCKTYEEIQGELNCGKNSPLRWINSAVRDLSILLFGVDGLKISNVG